jgi:hypothetical protein
MKAVIIVLLMLIFVSVPVLAEKCYWEAESPNVEFGYSEVIGYGNPQQGFRYYPITDYLSVKQVLLKNEYVNSFYNKDLNATTIKVRPKVQTSVSYLNDLELFNENDCTLSYKKCINGDCNSRDELTDAEKWKLFNKYYECKIECKTWDFCITINGERRCTENRWCFPKCERKE